MNGAVRILKRLWSRGRAETARSPWLATGLLAVGLLIALLIFTNFVASSRRDLSIEAVALRKESDYRRLLFERRDRFEQSLDRLQTNWVYLRSRCFQEDGEDMAFSAIQRSLDALAKIRQISVRSYRFEGARREGNLVVLPVNLDFSAPYSAVVSMLFGIENSNKKLAVTDCEILPLSGSEALMVRLTVTGYRYEEKNP